MIKKYNFVRLGGRWFFNMLYDGNIEDLEMIQGADVLLDLLAYDSEPCPSGNLIHGVDIQLTTEEPSSYRYHFVLEDIDSGGATYCCKNNPLYPNIWICNVTKQVFGDFPRNLYIVNYDKF